jgi:hypothetical protein
MATAAVKTLEDLEALPGEFLTCKQVAPILGAKEANIHMQAMDAPYMLGFPVIVIRSRVKIPKRPFLRFMREGIAE